MKKNPAALKPHHPREHTTGGKTRDLPILKARKKRRKRLLLQQLYTHTHTHKGAAEALGDRGAPQKKSREKP
jgi:hypothetical protein